ncbi:hypothetical protein OIV83_005371 [Microbotryomycetes sp. JL201]|nr:hypothetical protein OIV83_005371 [Microbotryomycetes sp. JL201]
MAGEDERQSAAAATSSRERRPRAAKQLSESQAGDNSSFAEHRRRARPSSGPEQSSHARQQRQSPDAGADRDRITTHARDDGITDSRDVQASSSKRQRLSSGATSAASCARRDSLISGDGGDHTIDHARQPNALDQPYHDYDSHPPPLASTATQWPPMTNAAIRTGHSPEPPRTLAAPSAPIALPAQVTTTTTQTSYYPPAAPDLQHPNSYATHASTAATSRYTPRADAPTYTAYDMPHQGDANSPGSSNRHAYNLYQTPLQPSTFPSHQYPSPNPPPHYTQTSASHAYAQQQPQLQDSVYRGTAPPPVSPAYAPVVQSNVDQLAQHQTVSQQQAVVNLLHSLGLSEYTHSLLQNGFDRMESLFDIQEEDFEVLGVRRGHRRMLQRELASLRGIPTSVPLSLSTRDAMTEDESPVMITATAPSSATQHHQPTTVQQTNRATFYLGDNGPPTVVHNSTHNAIAGTSFFTPDATVTASAASKLAATVNDAASATAAASAAAAATAATATGQESTKRRYRRHPKPDPHAPVKPVSAYVAFSHTVREEMKGASFTEIAKTVGERWQAMPKEDREALEAKAANAKEAYIAALAAYKHTPEYAAHQQYLTDFKRKYAQTTLPDSPPRSLSRSGSRAASSSGPNVVPRQLPTPSSTTPSSAPLPSASPSTSSFVPTRDGETSRGQAPSVSSATSYFDDQPTASNNKRRRTDPTQRGDLATNIGASCDVVVTPKVEHSEFESVGAAIDSTADHRNEVNPAVKLTDVARDPRTYQSQSSETGPLDDRSSDSNHAAIVPDPSSFLQTGVDPRNQDQGGQVDVGSDSEEDVLRRKERQAVAVLAQVVAESSSAAAAAARAAASAVKVVESVQHHQGSMSVNSRTIPSGQQRGLSSVRRLVTPDDQDD